MKPSHGLSGGGLSRSSPSLAAAFNLRQYSEGRRRLTPERTNSQPLIFLEKIDLIGGNGRWRQRRAEEEWSRRAVEEEKQRREQQALEEKRRRRRAELEARRRRQLEEEEKRRQEERERQRQEQLEQDERRRQEEERERQRRVQEERDWLARQPKTCENCGGAGKCPKCAGKGYLFAMFLAPTVSDASLKDCGRMMEGCDACHGFRQNLMAEVKRGTGRCAVCDGLGKIAPPDSSPTSPHRRRSFTMGGDASPKPHSSSPKVGAFH